MRTTNIREIGFQIYKRGFRTDSESKYIIRPGLQYLIGISLGFGFAPAILRLVKSAPGLMHSEFPPRAKLWVSV